MMIFRFIFNIIIQLFSLTEKNTKNKKKLFYRFLRLVDTTVLVTAMHQIETDPEI